jgi:translocation and assembly module TamB
VRRWFHGALAILGLLLLLLGGLVFFALRSPEMRERIRARIVREVEQATGARAELRKFDFDWIAWRVWIEDLVLHGTEAEGRAPFVQIQHAELTLSVRSWFSRHIDLRRLTITRPSVHIYVDEDGVTNIPGPRSPSTSDPIANLLKLRIGQLEIRDGLFEFDSREAPFQLEAREVEAAMDFEPGPQYRASLRIGALRLPYAEEGAVEGDVLLKAGLVSWPRLRFSRGSSQLVARGQLSSFRDPSIDGDFTSNLRLADFSSLPLTEGSLELQGTYRIRPDTPWLVSSKARASGLAFRDAQFKVTGVSITADVELREDRLGMRNVELQALGARWRGEGDLQQWSRFSLRGQLEQLHTSRVVEAMGAEALPWAGIASGPVEIAGSFTPKGVANSIVKADVSVQEADDSLPLTGHLSAVWNQATNRLDVGSSFLELPDNRLNFRGVLGQELEVSWLSSSFAKLEPFVRLASGQPDFEMPVRLSQGQARVHATISGPLDQPTFTGSVQATNLVYGGTVFESARGNFSLSDDELQLEKVSIRRNRTTLSGELRLPLREWLLDPRSPLDAHWKLQDASASDLESIGGLPAGFQGRFNAELTAGGTWHEPTGQLQVDARAIEYGGEKFEKGALRLSLASGGGARLAGQLDLGSARLNLDGFYRHPAGDWRNGDGTIRLVGQGLEISTLQAVRSAREGLSGQFALDGSANISVREGAVRLDSLAASGGVRQLLLGGKPLGSFRLDAKTVGEAIGASLALQLENTRVTGSGLVQLDENYTAEGAIRISRLPVSLLQRLASSGSGDASAEMPLEGSIAGEAVWRAPLAAPSQGSARLTLSELELRPRRGSLEASANVARQLVLRNSGPLVFDLDQKSFRVRSARFSAVNTDLELGGQYTFGARAPWEFSLRGTADLGIIGTFQPGIVADGEALIDAGFRGVAADPVVSGKMTIRKASIFLQDLPNGIENAEGVVYFESNRANIERLTGQTGGGAFELRGFVGLSQGETTYRLQAKANNVRVRYPEGVSTTLDADLALTGSSTRSFLSGNVMVLRAGINPRSDFASVIGAASAPAPSPVGQNEFLRNLLFDVRVRTGPNATLQSTYTQDLEVQADLRLRGSPAKPVVLGEVKTSQGDIEFFGNRYTVTRGEILFYNVAAIAPVIDLNLETRVRGITVFIRVSGPMSKLNVSYRSEPPLMSADIVALLTVGRAPTATGTMLPSTTNPGQTANMLPQGSGLLAGALSTVVSSRVEKFFGKSRIKIDPQMTGVENIPQARLSIEQSLSRDVTLTIMTNLARTQQQVVRLEWDLSREWQLIVVRDENGVFGADILYRKRFR